MKHILLTSSHNLLLSRVGLCSFTYRVLVCPRFLFSDKQGHNYIFPSWVCSGESDIGTSPSLPLNSVCPPQYHSTTDVCLRSTHLTQKLYNLMITRHLSFSLLVSLVISFCDVIKQLMGVEARSMLTNSRSGQNC